MLRHIRTVVAVAVVTITPALSGAWCARAAWRVWTLGSSAGFADLIVGVACVALTALLGYLTLAAATGSAVAVRQLRISPHGRPSTTRRRPATAPIAAAITTLVLMAAGGSTASAADGPAERDPALTVALSAPTSSHLGDRAGWAMGIDRSDEVPVEPGVVTGWTPQVTTMPDATARLVVGPSVATDAATPESHSSEATVHVVVRGESLWSIAAAALGPDATAGEVAAEWPRWWQANLEVVGHDPDQLLPGQHLRRP